MTNTIRIARMLATALFAAVIFSSCNSGGGPQPLPAPPLTQVIPAPTPAPTATPPVVPSFTARSFGGIFGGVLNPTADTNSQHTFAPNATAFGNGVYVAVADNGAIYTSPSGLSWTARNSTVLSDLSAVAFGNGFFTAVGASGAVLTSSNGTTWTKQAPGTTDNLHGVAFGSVSGTPTWVIVGGGNENTLNTQQIRASTPSAGSAPTIWGNNLAAAVGATSGPLNAVVFASGVGFVVVGDQNSTTGRAQIETSASGIATFALIAPQAGVASLSSIAYGNIALQAAPAPNGPNQWVAVGSGNGVHLITQANTAAGTLPAAFNLPAGGQPVAVSEGLGQVAYTANSGFVAVGTANTTNSPPAPALATILTSTSGHSGWSVRSAAGVTQRLNSVAFSAVAGQNVWVACGAQGVVVRSSEGAGTPIVPVSPAAWASQTSAAPSTVALNFIAGNATTAGFLAFGHQGTIVTSLDGSTWTSRMAGQTPSNLGFFLFSNPITFASSRYVAAGIGDPAYFGKDAPLLISNDGITWTAQDSGILFPIGFTGLYAVAFGNGTFVTVGDISSGSGVVLSSANPPTTAWVRGTSSTTNALRSVTFANGLFVTTGDPFNGAGYIATSTTGTGEWTPATSSVTQGLNGVAFGNGTFVAVGGSLNGVPTITTSTTGTGTWTPRTPPNVNQDLHGVAFGPVGSGSGFVTVGGGGIIMTSPTGVTWTVRPSGVVNTLNSVTFTNGQWIAVGQNIVGAAGPTILASSDGLTWAQSNFTVAAPATEPMFGVAGNGAGQIVVVGQDGIILTSP